MKIQFSKVLTLVSLLLFVGTLATGFFFVGYLIFSGVESIVDLAFLGTAIVTTGAIWQMVTKHYMSKAGLENTTKIRKGTYGEISRVRLEFIEGVLKLQQKYEVEKEEIERIDREDSPFDSYAQSSEDRIMDKIDSEDANNSESIE